MITKTTYFEVHCDRCSRRLEIDGMTAWGTENDAYDALHTFGWERLPSGRVICDSCLLTDKINEKWQE